MVKKLTIKEQEAVLRGLSVQRKTKIRKECQACAMKGHGLSQILKKAKSVLGPIAKTIGPVVLKKYVLPFVLKKIQGNGLKLAGSGLRLAGQRGYGNRKRKKK